jgi:hypothetical protein
MSRRGSLARARHHQTGFAPAVPHFANLPLAALHRTVLAGALGGHLVKRPLASLHGAANDGAPASIESEAAANSSLRIWHSPARGPGWRKLRRDTGLVNGATMKQFLMPFGMLMPAACGSGGGSR